jgi:iron complex outermembrane receptor protein
MFNPTTTHRLIALATGLTASAAIAAQDLSDIVLEEIIVTATKRAGGVDVQQAPVAVTVFNSSQLDAMHIRDLKAIGFSVPSVQLEDVGTQRGYANFSIRGLGINSSIPSIDPTVGVFIDGMYYGINSGVVLDIFDIESVEVLRGPQGLLFGRNVTGGAVVMNTTRPTEQFELNARAAYETGDNMYLSAVATGPLTDSIGWKLAGYYNDDGGWHTNLANGEDFGRAETTMVRGALEFEFTEDFELLLRAEHGQSEGDGPAAHNGGCVEVAVPGLCVGQYDADGFDFAVDERGYYDTEWTNLIGEVNWDIDFGDGRITNILAYREYDSASLSDIDSTPAFLFHAPSIIEQDQISNELRYSGGWDSFDLTAGIYYFTQDISYVENRQIPPVGFPPPGITGGGDQDQTTWGYFAQLDWHLSDNFTINLGGRYTEEEKTAQVATVPLNLCTFPEGCTNFDFEDSRSWSNFTPKVGIQYIPNDDTQLYAFVTRGFRSGGYNFRHTAVAIPNEAFDEEEQTSFEVGLKKDFADGRIRTNLAVYWNEIDDMQRELNLSDPVVGVVQLIRNTADSEIRGFDAEITAAATDNLIFKASVGYVDGEYKTVRFDLNGDGVIDDLDKALDIPRLAPWSYGAEVIYATDLSWGSLTAQASGYHRDDQAYTDNNLGQLPGADMVDARLAFGLMEEQLTISVFGRNLLDEVTYGGDTQLPFFAPTAQATFTPLNKGRIYGLEIQFLTN